MAQTIAVTDAVKSLAAAEVRFGLQRNADPQFFSEWRDSLPSLIDAELAEVDRMYRRLVYHRSESELLEGAVTLLAVSP